ncbi:MAG: AsmA family protein [Woeseiaceae bacterium]|nr:AsmA family protein [Woeseiaceae bacterium]
MGSEPSGSGPFCLVTYTASIPESVMGGLLKKLGYFFVAFVALFTIAAIAIFLFFDPNDYRDRIAEEVKRETGRDLVIEGDLELSFFPWFAVNIGKTSLSNAPGFGEEPFLSFEQAQLSVKLLPLLLDREISVGTATLDGFELNLAVASNGRNNWQDLEEARSAQPDADETAQDTSSTLDVAGVEIRDAAVSYNDAQAGERYSLSNVNLTTGRVVSGIPIDISSHFDFELQPADLSGDVSIETSLVPSDEAGITLGDTEISVLGVDATLSVSGEGLGGRLQIDAFSLKSLMTRLNIQAPVTADPDALGKIIFDGNVQVNEDAISVTGLELVVDDSTFSGKLSVARNEAGTISIDLAADSIDLDRYMEPATDASASSGDSVPVEIPADLIRAFNVRGDLTVETAKLSGMTFDNVTLGLNAADGNMRLHPITADLFDGKYDGDVRINASGSVPVLSVNENVRDVSLGSLAQAMFEQENITGTINGSFRLSGRGESLAAIQRSLGGSMSMELIDGAWEGTDLWYELRRARALYKQEPAPEPELPARTQFSSVKATGPVTDGVFRNDDLFAQLPFMQLTGRGSVDFAAARVDYRMTARILENPEFATDATAEELDEFTQAKIPLRITGSLADPTIAPDIGEMLKDEVKKKVEEEIKDKLLKKLFGDDE